MDDAASMSRAVQRHRLVYVREGQNSTRSGDVSRNPLADNNFLLLLNLIHYRKYVIVYKPMIDKTGDSVNMYFLSKENSYFSDNPYCKALETAGDVEFDRVDIERNIQSGPLLRLSSASLFHTLGQNLTGESSILLLYSLLHGNSYFLEYVLVRTNLDTLVSNRFRTATGNSPKYIPISGLYSSHQCRIHTYSMPTVKVPIQALAACLL